jgi:hypothetical protein
MTRRSFLRRDGVVIAIYLLLAVGLTWPLAANLTTHVAGRGVDDPALAWNLWWLKFSLFNLDTLPLYTNYLYYPLGVNLVADTSTFLNGIISLPIQFLFSVIVANNLTIYFALVLGGYGTFLLAREILARQQIGNDFAAAIAGAFYAFGAWHINYVAAGHFMLLSNEWIPFYALYLIRCEKGTWKNGALAGFFFALTAWTELTFIPFVAVLTALYVIYQVARLGRGWQQIFVDKKEELAGFIRINLRPVLLNLGVLGVVALIGVSPLLVSLFADSLKYGYYIAPEIGRAHV